MYAVKNDEGEWLVVDRNGSDHWQASHGDIYPGWFSANERASVFGGHVVELVEAPAKVVVTQDEADKLERAKVYGNPADVILALAANHHPDDAEHILRAYVNGWTVEKPKRYVLPMDGMGDNLGYSYIEDGVWWINTAPTRQYAVEHGYTVTQSDIDAAPDWVKAIIPVEVTDDDD